MTGNGWAPTGQGAYLDLHGKCAVIAGGAGGIGRVIAELLARYGCSVGLLDLPDQRADAEANCELWRSKGAQTMWLGTDVLSQASLEHALSEVEQKLGPIDILVNSAGKVIRKPALELREEDWDAVMDVCAKGTFLASQAVARRMRGHGGGSIVNMGSIFGMVGGQNRAAYASSKAAVVGLTKVLALEWSAYGIRVNVVAPAFARTPMTEGLLAGGLDVTNKALLAPLVEPADIAAAVAFLASGEASRMVTGQVIVVDGGWTTW